jgi:hypothetical protein
MPASLRPFGEQVLDWGRELFLLLSAFDEVRDQMSDDLAGERAEMLDCLDGINDAERERIRPVVIDSALSIFKSYAFNLAVRRIATANPLPAILVGIPALVLLGILLSHSAPVADLGHLHGAGEWVVFLGVITAGIWLFRELGRFWAVGRTIRVLIVAAGMFCYLAGPHVAPWDGLRRATNGQIPAFPAAAFQFTIPYPVWLGVSFASIPVTVVAVARLLLALGTRSTSSGRRRQVLGDSLLQALLDVAYRAQMMAGDAELAASPVARASLHRLIRLASRVAAREWVAAVRTGVPQIDRIVRSQGRAIAFAISRWERRAALAGAQLPNLSRAFSVAVVNAADNDWEALAGEATIAAAPKRGAWKLISQALSLVVPLGAAAGIAFGVRPLPQTLGALLTFLVGLSIARVLRWLDLSGDIDPGLTVSELLRKPK